MSSLYLYGIVGAQRLPVFKTEGLAGGLRVIFEGDVGAIAGAAPPACIQNLTREEAARLLVNHQQVLEEAMAQTTVLPVKFGTVAPDERAVCRMLTQGGDLLGTRLAEFNDRLQIEVVAQWRLDQVFAEIATEAEVAELRQMALSGGTEASIRLGQAVKTALDRRRTALSAELYAELGTVATDMAAHSPLNDHVALDVAVLLDRMDVGSLDGLLNRLDSKMAGQLNFRSIGPLPPLNFATVEVSFPSRDAIHRACQTLELGDRVSREEIRLAYHRLARERHPGAAPSDVQTLNAGMNELTEAYRTLMTYAQNSMPEGIGHEWIFDANAIADKVIINIVRQEMSRAAADEQQAGVFAMPRQGAVA
jgi:hypothetical protein